MASIGFVRPRSARIKRREDKPTVKRLRELTDPCLAILAMAYVLAAKGAITAPPVSRVLMSPTSRAPGLSLLTS